jgi:hypothetical protein
LLSQDSRGFQVNNDDHNAGPTRRLALVIGNKDYPWKPLINPVNDATDVAAALEQAGFKGNVQRVFNAQHDAMKRAVRDFVASVHPGDFAFVYYSGHGVEVRGINYLLPVDIPANATANEVEDDAVSAQRIAGDLDDRGAGVKVIVLDACRDNPIKGSKSAAGGLAPMEGLGSLIVFATEAGRTASDNSASRNGLFTQYLLKALTARGVSLDDAVRDVARQMAADTNRSQVPAIYGLLEKPVYLFARPVTVNVSPSFPALDPALEAWNTIKDTHNPQDFDDFVAAFPQSPYATSARLAANRLRREAASSTTAPSQPDRTSSEPPAGTGEGLSKPVVAPSSASSASGNSTAAQAAANRGLSFFNQKDYAHALPPLQEACTGGDAASCNLMGKLYEDGQGVNQDYREAVDFYKRACDLGDMPGCYDLGYLYEYGGGVNQDYPKAWALYNQACNGGYLKGCTNLGWMYKNGRGVAQDYDQAFSLFKLACDGNEVIGCENLGELYKDGQSVPVNLDEARELFAKSCNGGHNLACNELKALTDATDTNISEPLPQPSVGSNSAATKAAAEQGLAYFKQEDYAHALPALQEACTGGDGASCGSIGYLYETGSGVTQDYLKAADFYKQSCDLGGMAGCVNLGSMYEGSPGIAQDLAKAFALFKQACDGNEMLGCDFLGSMYLGGLSVPVNVKKARELFSKACQAGDSLGCMDLNRSTPH